MTQTSARFDSGALDNLRSTFRGALLEPGHALYDQARAVWNARVDRRPALIARCAGVADVLAAVRFAREQGALAAVRGGGHDIAGNGVCDGGVVIDVSPMKGARVDPARRTVRAQAGLTWGELDRETQAFGLATVGGQCSATGIAGVALGGGIGWLMREHGLTIDNLVSVDLVTADGRLVTASERENQELFWGLRGGGGNFGIVTELELRLHPVRDVVFGMWIHPAEALADRLRAFQQYIATSPDRVACSFIHLGLPALPQIPQPMHGAPGVAIAAFFNGSLEEAEPVLAPLREMGPPVGEIYGPMPYLAIQGMFDGIPAGAYGYGQCIRSSYFPLLSDDAIAAVIEQVRAAPSPLCMFEVAQLGGAVARVGEDETAFPGRAAAYFGMFQSSWRDPAEAERHIRWTDASWQAMRRFSSGGTHPGFLDAGEPEERIRESFGEAKMARLAALKRAWDPENFFRMNKNIKP